MNVAEIALTLEIPENTVKTRLRRAREKLKPLLQEEEWGGASK
ncbi:sigma factor-like helix-turn-helix DNA-binding protein [Ureibacillus acetophenoni]